MCTPDLHCNRYDGIFYNDSATKMSDIRDGTSNTAMICEVWGRRYEGHEPPPPSSPEYRGDELSEGMAMTMMVFFNWTPNSCHTVPWFAASFHPGGVNCAFADGSVHFIPDTIDLTTYQSLATIDGGEIIDGAKMP